MVLVFHMEITHVNVTPTKLVKNHIILKKNYARSLKKGLKGSSATPQIAERTIAERVNAEAWFEKVERQPCNPQL